MSKETWHTLNTLQLRGFAELSRAWHDDPEYREANGLEDNHYIGAIPADEVIRRLFNFTLRESNLYVPTMDENGAGFAVVEGRKAIVTSDTNEVQGIFKNGYQIHQYRDWLLGILADLPIGSAGLLKNRALAYVQFRMPENIKTSEGVEFFPFIVATDSCDGSLASTFKPGHKIVECDNTLTAFLGENTDQIKVKHTKYSSLEKSTDDVRSMLQITERMAESFAAEIAELCAIEVPDDVFANVMGRLVPIPDKDESKRGNTVATNKANTIRSLYAFDDRCAPWKGTAWGVLQAFNTYALWEADVRKGVGRDERNMENFLSGKIDAHDNNVVSVVREMVAASA